MTAAHRLPGVLMRRCRGARAVATFSGGVESRNAPARIAPATPCRSLGVERPDAQPEPPRAQSRSSARPAEPFNAASNERSPEPGRCLVSSEAPGCRGDAYTQPSPCEMTTHCMAKANAGDGGRHGCTQHFHHGCTKSRVGASDAGSIPATSTTTGVHGFDGALIRDGQPAMVPAASGSPLSRGPVRWAKSKLPTMTAITSFALRDVPAGRGVTNAGTLGGSNALKPKHSDRQRPARFAAGLCRLPRPFSSL